LKKVNLFKEEFILESLIYFLGEKKKHLLAVNKAAMEAGRNAF
ncbi:MAG: 2-oxoacid:ferredoxin oxidoreductase subunit gamma, partial [Acholeplasmataceae bacterium]|nr:2-oxoacid:ferredoxin oxidoreductase subunit gamma [Acholeplasmataceae bacterium]